MGYNNVTLIEDVISDNPYSLSGGRMGRYQDQYSSSYPGAEVCNCPECTRERELKSQYYNNGYNSKLNSALVNNPQRQQQLQSHPEDYSSLLTCTDVYKHVSGCEVCNRLYSHDNTIYVVIILLLVVACLILSKKAFNL